jgi:hypothetical protein
MFEDRWVQTIEGTGELTMMQWKRKRCDDDDDRDGDDGDDDYNRSIISNLTDVPAQFTSTSTSPNSL